MAIPNASAAYVGMIFDHGGRSYTVTGERDQILFPEKIMARAINNATVTVLDAISAAESALAYRDQAGTYASSASSL